MPSYWKCANFNRQLDVVSANESLFGWNLGIAQFQIGFPLENLQIFAFKKVKFEFDPEES